MSGFAIVNGMVVPNSFSCNAKEYYHDDTKQLNETERLAISKAIELWKTGRANGPNISVKALQKGLPMILKFLNYLNFK